MLQIATTISNVIFLGLIAGIPGYAMIKKVNVYDTFIDGAKDGFDVAVKLIPYLIAMITAIGMLRASGALTSFAHLCAPLLQKIGMPAEILPLALMRPFSGSASNAILVDLIHTYGANSFIAKTAACMIGSTETTFYVIAVYFGVVSITRLRYAVIAGLFADLVGIIAAVFWCHVFFAK